MMLHFARLYGNIYIYAQYIEVLWLLDCGMDYILLLVEENEIFACAFVFRADCLSELKGDYVIIGLLLELIWFGSQSIVGLL